MAHASPFAAPASRRRIAAGVIAVALAATGALGQEQGQDAERFGAYSVVEETQALPMSETTRPNVRLAWTSQDKRVELSLVDTGVVLMVQRRVRDDTGRVRCSSNGPLLVYDDAGWMGARWRHLGWEEREFLRTCHVVDQRDVAKYRDEFGHVEGREEAIATLRARARDAFGGDLVRCVDVRDGADPAAAGRDACERSMVRM